MTGKRNVQFSGNVTPVFRLKKEKQQREKERETQTETELL